MRFVYRQYDDKKDVLVRTDDRGGNPQVVSGELRERSKAPRMRIFIEVSCDDRDEVIQDARSALDQIKKNLSENGK